MEADVRAQHLQLLQISGNPLNYQASTHYQLLMSDYCRMLALRASGFPNSTGSKGSDSGSSQSEDNNDDDDDSLRSSTSTESDGSSEELSCQSESDDGSADTSVREARHYLANIVYTIDRRHWRVLRGW